VRLGDDSITDPLQSYAKQWFPASSFELVSYRVLTFAAAVENGVHWQRYRRSIGRRGRAGRYQRTQGRYTVERQTGVSYDALLKSHFGETIGRSVS
jgi:hypothetical protein